MCQQFELELKGRENSGVLQKYFLHRETADEDEFGRTNINKLSVASVHHIGIFDIRIANEDRHGGNLLLDENSYDGAPCLVPIDHEFTLPSWNALGNATFCWSTWPQVLDYYSSVAFA